MKKHRTSPQLGTTIFVVLHIPDLIIYNHYFLKYTLFFSISQEIINKKIIISLIPQSNYLSQMLPTNYTPQ